MKYTQVFLGLGSNVGDRELYLQSAVELLQCDENIQLLNQSSVIETLPVGDIEQRDFLNQVIQIATEFEAEQLLERCIKIEQSQGRIRKEKWGPRTLDIDILFFDNLQLNSQNLSIPHPEVHKRHFMLIPLFEIAPSLVHPTLHHSVEEMLGAL